MYNSNCLAHIPLYTTHKTNTYTSSMPEPTSTPPTPDNNQSFDLVEGTNLIS